MSCVKPGKGPKLAPADEYFGQLKMSFLGIRNELHDLTLRYDAEPDHHDAIFGMAVQTENSLRDWERKYPADGAVVRQIYFLRGLYAKFDPTYTEAQNKRVATEQWLFTCYSKTWYAKDVKAKLAAASPPAAQAVAPQPATAPQGANPQLPPQGMTGTGTIITTAAPAASPVPPPHL